MRPENEGKEYSDPSEWKYVMLPCGARLPDLNDKKTRALMGSDPSYLGMNTLEVYTSEYRDMIHEHLLHAEGHCKKVWDAFDAEKNALP